MIGPYPYTVEFVEDLKEGKSVVQGLCDFTTFKISIRTISAFDNKSKVPRELLETTFIHEVIEAINYHYELSLKHQNITLLETTLYDTFKGCGIIK